MREFAEQELVIPEGQFEGETFRPDRQPFAALLLDEIDSSRWYRIAVCGCVQAGKSLIGFDLPIMYHLFEVRETVVVGLPTQDLAWDKWTKEIRPAIAASRYASLIPTSGRGSRGGQFESIEFTNGASLKFMSGGGGDEKRSSYTARVVAITEADKMDQAGESSRETDPVSQIEARSLSWDYDQRRAFLECTVSIEEGRIWQEYTNGSESRIVCPCPHCRQWVTPERQHLEGWQAAETKVEARERTHFLCPACGGKIDDEARRTMNLSAKLLHRGQTIDEAGVVSGDLPKTDTLGFRWNAFNNLFWSIGAIGIAEWEAARGDLDSTEREMLQFYWARPAVPDRQDTTPLSVVELIKRTNRWPKGLVPADTHLLTVAIDCGKWTLHWLAVAWTEDLRGRVVDYGTLATGADSLGEEEAIRLTLCEFRDSIIEKGWTWEDHEAPYVPNLVFVDSGDFTSSVYAFIRSSDQRRYWAAKGQGSGQRRQQFYWQPKAQGAFVQSGHGWHVALMKDAGVFLVEMDSDQWKSWGHKRLAAPVDVAGSVTFYQGLPREHIGLAKHLTSEKSEEAFAPGRGQIVRWVKVHVQNHWFDCYYMACVATDFWGLSLLPKQETPKAKQAERPKLTMPDGRPFLVLER